MSETIDDSLDQLDWLVGDFYELRDAFKLTGNSEFAEIMNDFAHKIRKPVTHIRYLYHKEHKGDKV